jgi:hypothetical protein
MSEQEKEKKAAMSDDPDVEGHRTVRYGDEGSEDEGKERRESGDDPDVEAHRVRP